MTKRMKNEELELVETASKVEPVLTHSALSTYKDEVTGKWQLAKIRYNPLTGEVGSLEKLISDEGSKDDINYRFKISVIKEGIL